MTGVEALLRWQHPERGLLAPGEFIDIAEESGLIVPIGAWVLDQACRQLRTWQQDPRVPAGLQVAVNLSARQLAHGDLARKVEATISAAQLAFGDIQLCLEITESVVMQDPHVAAVTLAALQDLGVTIAIDDFGTGYSSLAYLKWFPIDIVKIDRSFIASLDHSATDRAIVKAVVSLARELDLKVVAEGVETIDQLDLLTELGCSHMQGFLLAKPGPAAQVVERLSGHAAVAAQRAVLAASGSVDSAI
jgi:EAL domain-containing protein (putative c-di-GMP-specific phosphodiesterase class I)